MNKTEAKKMNNNKYGVWDCDRNIFLGFGGKGCEFDTPEAAYYFGGDVFRRNPEKYNKDSRLEVREITEHFGNT